MKYAKEHYQLMERLCDGVLWNGLDEQERDILQYLDNEGIAEPRAYIQDGLWILSQKGRAVLQTHEGERETGSNCAMGSGQPLIDKEQHPGDKPEKRKINWVKVFSAVIEIVGFTASIVAVLEFLYLLFG